MGKEPQNLSVILSAWYLNHVTEEVTSNKKTITAHTAGDKCSWQATNECTFKLGWGTDPKGSFTDIPLTTIDRGQGQVPLLVGSVPYQQKVYIKVDATPTKQLSIFTQHTHAGAKDSITTDGYWAGTCYYCYLGDGQWAKMLPESSPGTIDQVTLQDLGYANFSPPYSLSSTSPQTTVTAIIAFFLSQVRECTYHCEQTMHESPWQPQKVQTSFVQSTPVADGKLQYDQGTTVSLNSTDRVLEVKNFKGPQMLSVSWPNENYPSSLNTPRRKKSEFFVFFHASYEQSALAKEPAYINSPYPYGDASVKHGGDYVQYGLYRYLRRLDPFDDPFPLGLPHSMRQSGKTAVTILPVNRQMTHKGPNKPELPNLNNGEQSQCLLEEIQCFMQRAQGFYFFDPDIGAMGCGSFSAGYVEMQAFQHAVRHHPYLSTTVQQFFLFDPLHGAGTGSANIAQQFRGTGSSVRLYNNHTSPEHAQFVHKRSVPNPPYVVDSDDGQFTVGVITDSQMRNTRSRMQNLPIPLVEGTSDKWVWQKYHANFVTTFLVDALRKSNFS
jgi:hypothetical protein